MNAETLSTGVELDVILTAEMPTPYAYTFPVAGGPLRRFAAVLRPGAPMLRAPCLAFVVRHPAAGTILVDTGMHADVREHLRRDFGAPMSVFFRQLRAADEPYDAQLRALGIDPAGVEHVLMTHLHVDHTSGMRLLPNTQFTCARPEWEAATRSRFPAAKGYTRPHLPAESRMRLLDFDRDGEPYATFDKTIDLLGDGSIRLLSTPGHTAGHLSVLLRLTHGREVLLVGDAAYTLRSIHEQILPLLTDDNAATLRSLRELKAYAEREPETILVPTHDPSAWHSLRDLRA